MTAWLIHVHDGSALLRPLVVGALAYTFGAVLEFLRWPAVWSNVVGPHEIFHLVAGACSHAVMVARIRSVDGAEELDPARLRSLGANA